MGIKESANQRAALLALCKGKKLSAVDIGGSSPAGMGGALRTLIGVGLVELVERGTNRTPSRYRITADGKAFVKRRREKWTSIA